MNYWAHRGLSFHYPENTLLAFKAACSYAIAGIELDVQLTRDGQPVVIHDETVDRTTDGRGYVKDYSLAELQKLHISYSDTYLQIPTLQEVLETLKDDLLGYDLTLNIELKNSIVPYPGLEEKVLRLVHKYGLKDHVVYSTFSFSSLKRMRELDPLAELAVLGEEAADCLKKARELGVRAIHLYIGSLKGIDVSGYTVRAWNDQKDESFYPDTWRRRLYKAEELRALGITDYISNLTPFYVPRRYFDNLDQPLFGDTGVDEKGCLIKEEGSSVNLDPVALHKGETVISKLPFRVYIYQDRLAERYIHTYDYAPQGSSLTYLKCEESKEKKLTVEKDCHARFVFSTAGTKLSDRLQIAGRKDKAPYRPKYRLIEDQRIAERVEELREDGDQLFILAADSHHYDGSLYEHLIEDLRALNKKCRPDGIIYLGDITDGLLTKEQTTFFVRKFRKDIGSLGLPVWSCIGNHDFNYFKDNPEVFSRREAEKLYLDGKREDRYADSGDLRFVFLSSFAPQRNKRYGFSFRSLLTVLKAFMTAGKRRIIIFSHVPPLPEIHYWSDSIRLSSLLMKILVRLNHKNRILAYIHGHNHADQVYHKYSFPIVGISAMKLEDFKDRKPAGSITYLRERDTIFEAAIDLLLVKKDRLVFLCYGAGQERSL